MSVEIIRPAPGCPDSCLNVTVEQQRKRASGEHYDVCSLDCHRRTEKGFLSRDVIFMFGKIEVVKDQPKS